MSNSYNPAAGVPGRLRSLLLTALLAGGAMAAQAQALNYGPAAAQNLAGGAAGTLYTDLGTTGTAIATPNTDDANSAPTNIGFTFNFNGQSYTQFVLNTNGFLKMGTTAPVAPFFFAGPQDISGGPLNSATETNLLLPFNTDLTAGTSGGTEYRIATTGTAPNRVSTIQWKNVADKANGAITTQYANFSFQVKLYETSNQIDFVYGTAIAGTGADNFRTVAVGLKGSGVATNQLLTVQKGSQGTWGQSLIQQGNYTPPAPTGVTGHNIRQTVRPDAGRTYRFVPSSPNDAAVSTIYTLGKLPLGLAPGHVVRALINNPGTGPQSGLVVTLTVTGPGGFTFTNTQTASIASGGSTTVAFAPYTPTVTGLHTLTVSVPNDGNNGNNTGTVEQLVTLDTFSYRYQNIPVGLPNAGLGFPGPASFVLGVKYTTSTARRIVSVPVAIANDQATVGKTLYALVYGSTGLAPLDSTAKAVITAAELGTTKMFTFPAPVNIPAGDFYVGVGQLYAPGQTGYFPIDVQTEVPARTGIFVSLRRRLTNTTPPADQSAAGSRLLIDAMFEVPSCLPVINLANSTTTTNTVNITFTPPSTTAANYTIIYGPVGFNPNTGGTSVTAPANTSTTNPFTLTGLMSNTTYQVYVRTNCTGTAGNSTLAGPITFSTQCQPPTITTFPYTENFDNVLPGQAVPCGITVLNNNNDNFRWAVSTETPFSAPNAMRYNGATAIGVTADDWFFTPGLSFTPNARYQLSFRYKALTPPAGGIQYVESMEVKVGASATVMGQTTTLWTNNNINNPAYMLANQSSTPAVAIITGVASDQYIGFHAMSSADQGNLYVDDVTVTQVLATSEALARAVTVFPNPSTTGRFDLEIHGANAKGALQVEVVNMLGQQVYVGTARDNFTNNLDLSKLAAGIYHLKVRNGSEFMLRQVAIVK